MRSRGHFDPARVPDPFAMLLVDGESPRGRLLRRQRTSRARALATTRRMLSETPERFTMRGVAEACGVTAQTLRNGFGRRDELMVAAFNDHTSAVWRALDEFSGGPQVFLDLAQMYHGCAVASPGFLRAMVLSAMADIGSLAGAQRHGSSIKSRYLLGMAHADMLRPGTDPGALAAHITRLNTFMMYEWAIGGDSGELRDVMIDGNRRLLLGAVTADHVEAVEQWRPGSE